MSLKNIAQNLLNRTDLDEKAIAFLRQPRKPAYQPSNEQLKSTYNTLLNTKIPLKIPLMTTPLAPVTNFLPNSVGFTPAQGQNLTADLTYRPITRSSATMGLEALNKYNFMNKSFSHVPTDNSQLGRILFGNEPIRPVSYYNKLVSEYMQDPKIGNKKLPFSVSEKKSNQVAPFLVAAALGLDLTPFGMGKESAVKTTIKNANKFDEFYKLYRRNAAIRKEADAIIANKSNEIKTVQELYHKTKFALGQIERTPILKNRGRNSYTNVPDVDNPLLKGEKGVEEWRKNFKPNEAWLDDPLPWESTPRKAEDFISSTKPKVDDLKKRYEQIESIEDMVSSKYNKVEKKVNILDYFRTPDRVFKKLGLEKESKLLRKKYDEYLIELPKEIDKVTAWSKRVTPAGNVRIFKYLDGKLPRLDNPTELEVAREIRAYLKEWAVKLKLPEDRQISDYITHIYEKGAVEQEIDPELAKIIRGKVAKSVYDPFLEKRIGKPDYIEDTWRALDAYVKRATRKYHMDEALEGIEGKAENLPEESYNYIKGRIARINMQPTQADNLIDNFVKSTPVGYRLGQRPVTRISQVARQWVYRGLLGINPQAALRNLQQSSNTYATLGEKYFVKGLMKTLLEEPRYLTNRTTELDRTGVLANNFIQDRTLSATKKLWEKLDKGLFYMFDQAEKWNRSVAYYGAKFKALDKGMSEDDAVEYAKQIVRKTQFAYDTLDTPAVVQGDIMKTLFQFSRYPLSQTEFLVEMIKDRNVTGVIRYTVSTLVFIYATKEVLGLSPRDALPSYRFGAPPTTQFGQGLLEVVFNTKNEWGGDQDPNIVNRAIENRNLGRGILNYIPGGSQAYKTYTGLDTVNKGYSETKSGRVRFPVDQSKTNYLLGGLFGQYRLPEAREYFDNDRSPVGDKDSEAIKNATDRDAKYQEILERKKQEKLDEEAKEKLRNLSDNYLEANNKFYYKKVNGDIRIVDRQAEFKLPELTGDKTFDKMALEDYRDDLSTRINDIYLLGQEGAVDSQTAKNQIQKLLDEYNSVRAVVNTSASGKKPISMEDYLLKRQESYYDSQIQQIYRDYREGNISLAAAKAKLSVVNDALEEIKKATGGKKAKKPKKISIKSLKPISVKSSNIKISTGKMKALKLPKQPVTSKTRLQKALQAKYKVKDIPIVLTSKPKLNI